MTRIRSIIQQLPKTDEQSSWYAFRTMYKREKLVDKRLKSRGIESYVPLRTIIRHYKSKTTTAKVPFFSSYIFARIRAKDYALVLGDADVFEIVKFQGEVGRVSDDEIDFLKSVLKDEDLFEPQLVENIAEGSKVVVSGGVLAGTRGIVLESANRHSFVVKMKNLGIDIQIQIARAHLTPLKD